MHLALNVLMKAGTVLLFYNQWLTFIPVALRFKVDQIADTPVYTNKNADCNMNFVEYG